MTRSPTPQAFSVDVEEYFQVSAFEEVLTREEWEAMPSRVGRSVETLLEMMARHSTTGTFFILGWVAQKHPDIPRRIAGAGHEIASHGWWHRRVPTLAPEEFRREVRDSRRILEDLTGKRVLGFRAPSFSLLAGQEWAYDVLIEEGYVYDSSVFPIRRPNYGNPGDSAGDPSGGGGPDSRSRRGVPAAAAIRRHAADGPRVRAGGAVGRVLYPPLGDR